MSWQPSHTHHGVKINRNIGVGPPNVLAGKNESQAELEADLLATTAEIKGELLVLQAMIEAWKAQAAAISDLHLAPGRTKMPFIKPVIYGLESAIQPFFEKIE
jgi:hypothetical protein